MARTPPLRGRTAQRLLRDQGLWNTVAKTIEPLARRKTPDPTDQLDDGIEKALAKNAGRHLPVHAAAGPTLPSKQSVVKAARSQASKSIEPGLLRRLERGRLPIDGVLDLHGLTQDAAHAALVHFIKERSARGDRTLLIITGKGLKKTGYLQLEQRGILRDMVPVWLNAPDLAPLIAGIEPAHQTHGGGGALYVRLKRPRQP